LLQRDLPGLFQVTALVCDLHREGPTEVEPQ
jgi:hypothetical protein